MAVVGGLKLMMVGAWLTATVAVSEDPQASAKISTFAGGNAPWIVAVRMVSEGVDIPRLRVGVYATTTTTELFFRQAVGVDSAQLGHQAGLAVIDMTGGADDDMSGWGRHLDPSCWLRSVNIG